MNRHAIVTDIETEAATLLALGHAEAARDTARAGLHAKPDAPGLLLVLLEASRTLRDIGAADEAAERLAALPLTETSLDALMNHAIGSHQIGEARRLLAQAEATPDLSAWVVVRAKARVAQADGDLPAATAILVSGIEASPDATPLRALLTEILMAGGSAGHARDVLARLGLPPTVPPRPDDVSDDTVADRAEG